MIESKGVENGHGAQGRNRTTDTVIFSHVLYQLSYLGAGPAQVGRSARRGRYKGSNPHCLEHRPSTPDLWFNANSCAEPLFQRNAVAQRQHAGWLLGGNQYAGEKRLAEMFQPAGKIGQGALIAYIETCPDAAGASDTNKVDSALSMARLHTGFAINAIVENNHSEIGRPLDADGRERTEPHQNFPIACDHGDAPLRLC